MDFIVNPFTTLLVFLYSIFNDMVLAIAVFTVLIRLLTYPLTAQQMRSSAAMQKLQPELKKLQEKYKNDRETLAQEQMKLYREAGINPLGGCLPLFIQFPIFIALYQAILHALASTPTQLLDLSGRLLIPGMDRTIPLNNIWLGMNLTQPPNFGSGGLPMGGGGGQMGMMRQLQKMQQEMAAAQAALETETVETSVGGGAVKVVITGHQRVQSITINPDAVDTSDSEWVTDLQDLLVLAVNQAIEQSQTMAAKRMEAITGGLGDIPGLSGLLGG